MMMVAAKIFTAFDTFITHELIMQAHKWATLAHITRLRLHYTISPQHGQLSAELYMQQHFELIYYHPPLAWVYTTAASQAFWNMLWMLVKPPLSTCYLCVNGAMHLLELEKKLLYNNTESLKIMSWTSSACMYRTMIYKRVEVYLANVWYYRVM